MTRLLIVPILLATLTAAGCSDDGGNGTGVAGSGGGSTGSAGTGGTGSGGTGGGSAFMAVAPCNAASDYVTSPTTIDFGLLGSAFSYAPKCLKVPTGTQVTFTSTTSDFAVHPLDPSGNRGTRPGNPITPTATGTTASFTFPAKGFWAYYCTVHGSSDDGSFMAGVIWAD
jgi:plastocyanin